MSVPLQLLSRHCSQEVFMAPVGMLDPVVDLDVGCMGHVYEGYMVHVYEGYMVRV